MRATLLCSKEGVAHYDPLSHDFYTSVEQVSDIGRDIAEGRWSLVSFLCDGSISQRFRCHTCNRNLRTFVACAALHSTLLWLRRAVLISIGTSSTNPYHLASDECLANVSREIGCWPHKHRGSGLDTAVRWRRYDTPRGVYPTSATLESEPGSERLGKRFQTIRREKDMNLIPRGMSPTPNFGLGLKALYTRPWATEISRIKTQRRMKDWNDAVDRYINNESLDVIEIENEFKIGLHGGPLYRSWEADGCYKTDSYVEGLESLGLEWTRRTRL